jgi:hypothetical protein
MSAAGNTDAVDDADEAAPEPPPDELPDEVLIYTLPSLSDVLGGEAWGRFGGLAPSTGTCRRSATTCTTIWRSGMAARQRCRWQRAWTRAGRASLTWRSPSTGRSNIPARYVFGYLPDLDVPLKPDPMDFAGWLEVWPGRAVVDLHLWKKIASFELPIYLGRSTWEHPQSAATWPRTLKEPAMFIGLVIVIALFVAFMMLRRHRRM